MPFAKQENALGIGILGCGPIAQFAHLEAVQKGRNVVLKAVCDADKELADRFGQFYDASKIYYSYDDMLADPEVKAVVIAVSDAFHVPCAIKALAAGKHVFCEKPIATSVEDVEELQRHVQKSGLILRIGHMLRFDPGIQAAHDFVKAEMGEMLALKAWYCDSTHRYTMTDAIQAMPRLGKASVKPSGDPKANKQRYYMLAHGSHLVDLARYLAGPITAVSARLGEKFGAYCWFVDTEFANGTLGHLDLTVSVRMDWSEGFQIYGEKGSASAKIFNPWYYKSSEVDIFRESTGASSRILGADGHFYRRQIEGFADAVLSKVADGGADIVDGVASVRAMVAIAKSVATMKSVTLSEVSGPL
ncbi:MAG: Gfo/Idh/MocA family oxidoreductase [Aestuariivirga sp.]